MLGTVIVGEDGVVLRMHVKDGRIEGVEVVREIPEAEVMRIDRLEHLRVVLDERHYTRRTRIRNEVIVPGMDGRLRLRILLRIVRVMDRHAVRGGEQVILRDE